MKKTPLQRAYNDLSVQIKAYKKEITNKSFKDQNVFAHHEDGSHYIFYNSFYEKFLAQTENDIGSYQIPFYVVFSRETEPQIFHTYLFTIHQYGEAVENDWEKTKTIRPRLIHKPAHDYLKKQGRDLSCPDFDWDTIAVIRMRNIYMSLRWAVVEETDDTYYVFTEHNGYYAIPKKIGHVTVSKWNPLEKDK